MYTDQDLARAEGAKKKRLALAFSVLAIAVVVLVVGLVIRMEPLATFGTALFACLFYAALELYAMPHVRYARYLRDIKEGLSRETDAEYVSISSAPRTSSGVLFYDFVVRVGPEPEDERLFYYDADKPLPNFAPGAHVHITSFGNYITEIKQT